ncbi:MAG: hypothetical protein RLZZ15_832, partial [Verrucomicrobiota bacterium]
MNKILAVVSLALLALSPLARAQSYTFSTASTQVYYTAAVAVDSTGGVFVSDYYGSTIVKLSPSGVLLSQYGNGSVGSADGTGTAARFYYPRGLALDGTGNLYVADTSNHTIRRISATGAVTTLAGAPLTGGAVDGPGAAARFSLPQGIAVDATGNVYIADTGNHAIRKITPAGVVSTFAGALGQPGSDDGSGGAARFFNPQGLTIDATGTLYVADTNSGTIRKITSAGVVTTVAGLPFSHGNLDGAGVLARFNAPQGVAVDSAGNLFVADTQNALIRKISPAGNVSTIGGVVGVNGTTSGLGASARFYGPRSVAVDASGNIFVADTYYLRLGVPSDQLAITVQPQGASVASGSSLRLTVTATGGTPITYQWQKDGTTIAGATSATLALTSVNSATAATYTVTVRNPIGTVASTGAVVSVVAPVANDDFVNAQSLSDSSGQTTGTNNGATGEPGEPTHGVAAATASSVWYKWTPTESGTAVFSISSAFTPSIAVWTGTGLTNLSRVAQTASTRLSFRAQAGTTYYLALGGYYGTRGTFSLSWRTILNDDFASAQVISGNSLTVSGNNDGATLEAGESALNSAYSSSLWYRWTPTVSGTATLDLPTYLDASAYTGNSLASLRAAPRLAFTISTNGTNFSRRIFNVDAGTTYSIVIATTGYSTGAF